jgi:hypothetical protein
MDFLIHFQRNVIKNCSVEGIDPRMLSAMRDILHILEAVKEIGILTELPNKGSHHYCPNCYREDDDGNRTIKAPFPYYVQKINRFMNRIAKSYPCRIVEEDDHFALHGNTQDGKQLAPCDEEWVRSYAADKLLGIQMIDKGCANAEYIIRLRKE